MLIQHTLLETIEQKMAELIELIKCFGSAPSTEPVDTEPVDTEPVDTEPVDTVFHNASQTEAAMPLVGTPQTAPSTEGEQGGELLISKPTAEQSRVLKGVFGLSPAALEKAGLQSIHSLGIVGSNGLL